MTKRNITIIGIILILIAITIISVVRRQVSSPVALSVGNAVVKQANPTRLMQHQLTDEVGALARTLETNQVVADVGRLVAQRETGVELAVVLRAAVPRLDQVQVNLV